MNSSMQARSAGQRAACRRQKEPRCVHGRSGPAWLRFAQPSAAWWRTARASRSRPNTLMCRPSTTATWMSAGRHAGQAMEGIRWVCRRGPALAARGSSTRGRTCHRQAACHKPARGVEQAGQEAGVRAHRVRGRLRPGVDVGCKVVFPGSRPALRGGRENAVLGQAERGRRRCCGAGAPSTSVLPRWRRACLVNALGEKLREWRGGRG